MGKALPAKDMATDNLSHKMFVGTLIGMSWQMAATVLLPTIIGIKLDSYYHSDPKFTLCGLLFAVIATIVIVRRVIKDLNTYMMTDNAAQTAEKKDNTTTK